MEFLLITFLFITTLATFMVMISACYFYIKDRVISNKKKKVFQEMRSAFIVSRDERVSFNFIEVRRGESSNSLCSLYAGNDRIDRIDLEGPQVLNELKTFKTSNFEKWVDSFGSILNANLNLHLNPGNRFREFTKGY